MNKTVGIIGGTVWGNRGAEAMLVTAIHKVREQNPETNIVIFSYLAKKDLSIVTDATVHIHDARPITLVLSHFPYAILYWLVHFFGISLPNLPFFRSAYALSQCDILLDIGGISFADKRSKFLPFNILIFFPAVLMGVQVTKLAQAMGPFTNPVNRLASKVFLPMCEQIYARGKITASHLEDLGLDRSKWQHAPDVALLYQPDFSISDENPERVSKDVAKLVDLKAQDKTIIALCPSSVVFQQMNKRDEDYIDVFLQLIRDIDPSYHYVIVPNATRENSTKLRNNDLLIINTLWLRAERELAYETRHRIHPIAYDINTAGTRELLQYADVVVTSRFHGMISALSLAVPVCVIGWSHKYEEILMEFDMQNFAVDYGDVDENLAKLVAKLVEDRNALHEQIRTRLPEVQSLSQMQFNRLDLR